MTIVHVAFHIIQFFIGSSSLYALLINAFQIAVFLLFITVAMESLDRLIVSIDDKVKSKYGI